LFNGIWAIFIKDGLCEFRTRYAVSALFMFALISLASIPLFIIFLNVDIYRWPIFIVILIMGDIGIAAASTITAAMVAKSQGKNALFTVLTFPILLPQFLGSISATTKILANIEPNASEIVFMAGYNVVLMIASSILFDYLWYD